MPKTITLPLPDEFEADLKKEMAAAALNAFRSVAGKHRWADYLQRKDCAERLGISVSKLDDLTRRGLPTVVIDGLKLYRNASVDKWMLEHEI